MVTAGVWRCEYCGREAIHIGNEYGSSDTNCPSGCCGRFAHVKDYPLATGLEGIKEAFGNEDLP